MKRLIVNKYGGPEVLELENFNNLKNSFVKFLNKTPAAGKAFVCIDDHQLKKIIPNTRIDALLENICKLYCKYSKDSELESLECPWKSNIFKKTTSPASTGTIKSSYFLICSSGTDICLVDEPFFFSFRSGIIRPPL